MRHCRSNPKPIPHELTHLWWERFLSSFKMSGGDGCWEWTGTHTAKGYGVFAFADDNYLAHRITFEVYNGKLAAGMEPDHTCRNRRCVNPDHLEAVTYAENQRRAAPFSASIGPRTLCHRGHDLTGENRVKNGKNWACEICLKARRRSRYLASKAERLHADSRAA